MSFKGLILLFAILLTIPGAFAVEGYCELKMRGEVAVPKGRAERPEFGFTSEDGIQQWLNWERQANHSFYIREDGKVQVPTIEVPRDQLLIETDDDVGERFLRALTKDGKLLFYKHPFNTDSKAPFYKVKPTGSVEGDVTASRSIDSHINEDHVSLKMGTNRPFSERTWYNPWAGVQPQKISIETEVTYGPRVAKYLKFMEKKLGSRRSNPIQFLHDVLGVQDPVTLGGYVVRDLSRLDSSHFYLPGQSIPFAGRSIPGDFITNLIKGYYAPRGRGDARNLLDFGLIPLNKTPQNNICELNSKKEFTGNIFSRDETDNRFWKIQVDFFSDEFSPNLKPLFILEELDVTMMTQGVIEDLVQNFVVSLIERDQEWLLTPAEVTAFQTAYKSEYKLEMELALNMKFSSYESIFPFLNSEAGHKAMKNYLIERYR